MLGQVSSPTHPIKYDKYLNSGKYLNYLNLFGGLTRFKIKKKFEFYNK